MSERKRAMQSAVWERRYEPIDSPDGCTIWSRYADVKDLELHTVWSIVEGDNGDLYVVPGFHVVNHFGYAVTAKPWSDADLESNLFAIW